MNFESKSLCVLELDFNCEIDELSLVNFFFKQIVTTVENLMYVYYLITSKNTQPTLQRSIRYE